ncbi:hypothetical protein TNCV_3354341 [Trichonephila clavipes]|nr:hypothetical protein TNCV_3354341 [Trichonephila clavipes]
MPPVCRSRIEVQKFRVARARSTPVVGLEHHTGDSTIKLGEILRRDDIWRLHLSPLPGFMHGTEGEGNILQSPALVTHPTRLRTH